MNPTEHREFEFTLSKLNKLKPGSIDHIDLQGIIKRGDQSYLNRIIENFAMEDFETNEDFKLRPEEQKLVRSMQVLTQYMQYSIEHLQKKNLLLGDLANQQSEYLEKADEVAFKQSSKIRQLEEKNKNAAQNLMNMEFLIKRLKIDENIDELGRGITSRYNLINPHRNSNDMKGFEEYEKDLRSESLSYKEDNK